jgi:hypothetical protein
VAQPPLRRAFDKIERSVGRPLEDAVASQRYVDFVVKGLKAQRAVTRTARRAVDRQIARALHLINVPAYSDLRRLSRQLTTLTGEVRALTQQTDRLSVSATRLEERQASYPAIPHAGDELPSQADIDNG